jgi:hypothetical protein
LAFANQKRFGSFIMEMIMMAFFNDDSQFDEVMNGDNCGTHVSDSDCVYNPKEDNQIEMVANNSHHLLASPDQHPYILDDQHLNHLNGSPENVMEEINNGILDDCLGDSIHIAEEGYYDGDSGLWFPPTFDPQSGNQGVTGEPAVDMDSWHMQNHKDTCAVVSQEFIIEELTGQMVDEDQLREIAMENGWYSPGAGTPMGDTGNLLEEYGLNVDKHDGSSMAEIENALSHGEKVIVGVNSAEIVNPGTRHIIKEFLQNVLGIPGNDANHAVEVIGVDQSDPEHPMVVLNDPGHPRGKGAMIPLHDFKEAWGDSNNFIVIASK